jgi:hypothetical protein
MTLKRRLFMTAIRFCQFLFQRKKLNNTLYFNLDANKTSNTNQVDIITVAFNNAQLIRQQIRLVKKYITDKSYTHIIADNSSDLNQRQIIRKLCEDEAIAYISLPKQWFNQIIRKPSYSHGASLNWLYYNVIKLRQPAFFAFIDHDIFPIHNYSFTKHFDEQTFYGEIKEQSLYWYLWAGFCCYKFSDVQQIKLDFFPHVIKGVYLDTGGANYPVLYKHYDKNSTRFTMTLLQRIREEDNDKDVSDYHANFIKTYDNAWIHTINGSNWAKIKAQNQKRDILNEILSKY